MTAPVSLRDDLTTRATYVSDASVYRRLPAAVAEPCSADEIKELLATARQHQWPVTVRGGGTSVAGNAIGDGLVIDVSRHFNRIISIDPSNMTATVEPGVLCDQLRHAAASHGLTYGPDPSTHSYCTVGGMVANNACGSHSIAWGTSADNLVAVRVMLADGREVDLYRGGSSHPPIDRALGAIRDRHRAVLRTELGQFPRQVSGYGLHHLLSENGFDLAKAFAGSEGTCGIITQLTVRLVRKPAHTTLAVLGFEDAFTAAAAAPELCVPGVYTVEGMGADLLQALRTQAQRGRPAADTQLLPRGGGWLYCETGGHSSEQARALAHRLHDLTGQTVVDSAIVSDPADAGALWQVREQAAGIVTRLPDGGEAWPGWEDSAVPAEHLSNYLGDLYGLMREFDLTGIPFGHFGEGCVHIRLSFNFNDEPGRALHRTFLKRAAQLARSYGGSISGEHGDGRARSELLGTIYSSEALQSFAEFKHVFDPGGVFNPGVLVDPEPLDLGVWPAPSAEQIEVHPVHAYSTDGGSFSRAVHRCVGIGECRSDEGAMCPSFQITHDEVDSTRGRARSLAEMLRGEQITDGWKSKEALNALDLCLSCKACATECPVNVDMATYKAEFLHHHYGNGPLSFVGKNRRPVTHLSMGWLPLLMQTMEKMPFSFRMINRLERIRPVEELTKRLGGIEPRRRMITFASKPLTKRFGSRRQRDGPSADHAQGDEKVVLWPDTFTNYTSDRLGLAAVGVLEAMGYDVLLPARNVCCGLTWHSTGQLHVARRQLRKALETIEPLLEAGYPVIGIEPSCTVMLQTGATELLPDDPRAMGIEERTMTLGDFTARHLAAGRTWPFEAESTTSASGAVCQVHCHQRSMSGYDPELRVLRKLGIETTVVGGSCCGLAGNWGFEPGHYEVSRALGERTLFPAIRAADDDTFVLADGFSCRAQINEGTGVSAVHLAEVLHAALFNADSK